MNREIEPFRKDFRTGSPQRVFRAIIDELRKLNYKIDDSKTKNPSPQEFGGISDIATFDAKIVAKDEKEVNDEGRIIIALVSLVASLILLIISVPDVIDIIGNDEFNLNSDFIMLIIGVTCIAVAIRMIMNSQRPLGKILEVNLEGEIYRASAEKIGQYAETLDVVSDTRLTITPKLIESGRLFSNDNEMAKSLENDFAEIVNRINTVSPWYKIE